MDFALGDRLGNAMELWLRRTIRRLSYGELEIAALRSLSVGCAYGCSSKTPPLAGNTLCPSYLAIRSLWLRMFF